VATLRTLDLKVRQAADLARERFGWIAATTSRLLVFPDDRTIRRRVERHRATIASVLPLDGHAVRAWIGVTRRDHGRGVVRCRGRRDGAAESPTGPHQTCLSVARDS